MPVISNPVASFSAEEIAQLIELWLIENHKISAGQKVDHATLRINEGQRGNFRGITVEIKSIYQ